MAKSTRQSSPKDGITCVAPHMARYGAKNEAMALMNCPKVSVDAKFFPPMTLDTSGLSEVCISALPMPRSEKDTSITPKDLPNNGMNNDSTVTAKESRTVFLRPMRFINMPVGTEKMRNQKNTNDGKMLAVLSFSPKSSFT